MDNFNEMDLGLLDSLLMEKLDNLNNRLNNEELSDWQTNKLEEEKAKLWALKTKLFSGLLKGGK